MKQKLKSIIFCCLMLLFFEKSSAMMTALQGVRCDNQKLLSQIVSYLTFSINKKDVDAVCKYLAFPSAQHINDELLIKALGLLEENFTDKKSNLVIKKCIRFLCRSGGTLVFRLVKLVKTNCYFNLFYEFLNQFNTPASGEAASVLAFAMKQKPLTVAPKTSKTITSNQKDSNIQVTQQVKQPSVQEQQKKTVAKDQLVAFKQQLIDAIQKEDVKQVQDLFEKHSDNINGEDLKDNIRDIAKNHDITMLVLKHIDFNDFTYGDLDRFFKVLVVIDILHDDALLARVFKNESSEKAFGKKVLSINVINELVEHSDLIKKIKQNHISAIFTELMITGVLYESRIETLASLLKYDHFRKNITNESIDEILNHFKEDLRSQKEDPAFKDCLLLVCSYVDIKEKIVAQATVHKLYFVHKLLYEAKQFVHVKNRNPNAFQVKCSGVPTKKKTNVQHTNPTVFRVKRKGESAVDREPQKPREAQKDVILSIQNKISQALSAYDIVTLRELLVKHHASIRGIFVNNRVLNLVNDLIDKMKETKDKQSRESIKQVIFAFLLHKGLRSCLNAYTVNSLTITALACWHEDIAFKVLEVKELREKLYTVDVIKKKFKKFFHSSPVLDVKALKAFVRHADIRAKLDQEDKNNIFKGIMTQVKPYEQMDDYFKIMKIIIGDASFGCEITKETQEKVLKKLRMKFDQSDDTLKRSIASLTLFLRFFAIAKTEDCKNFFETVSAFFKEAGQKFRQQLIQAITSLDVQNVKSLIALGNHRFLCSCSVQEQEKILLTLHNIFKSENDEQKEKAQNILDILNKHDNESLKKSFYGLALDKDYKFLAGYFYAKVKEPSIVVQNLKKAVTSFNRKKTLTILKEHEVFCPIEIRKLISTLLVNYFDHSTALADFLTNEKIRKILDGKLYDTLFFRAALASDMHMISLLLAYEESRALLLSSEKMKNVIFHHICALKGGCLLKEIINYPEVFQRFTFEQKEKILFVLSNQKGLDPIKTYIMRKVFLNNALCRRVFSSKRGKTILSKFLLDIKTAIESDKPKGVILLDTVCRDEVVRSYAYYIFSSAGAREMCEEIKGYGRIIRFQQQPQKKTEKRTTMFKVKRGRTTSVQDSDYGLFDAVKKKEDKKISGILHYYKNYLKDSVICTAFEKACGSRTSQDVIYAFLNDQDIRKKLSGELFAKVFKRAIKGRFLAVVQVLLRFPDVQAKFFQRPEFASTIKKSLDLMFTVPRIKDILFELVQDREIRRLFDKRQKDMIIRNCSQFKRIDATNSEILITCLDDPVFRREIEKETLQGIFNYFEGILRENYSEQQMKYRRTAMRTVVDILYKHNDLREKMREICKKPYYETISEYFETLNNTFNVGNEQSHGERDDL